MTGLSDHASTQTLPLISLLLPTRGRPALAARFLRSLVDQAAHPEALEVIIYADEDDAGSHHLGHPDIQVHTLIGPRKTMGQYNAACLAQSHGEIIILANDDIVVQTKNWDTLIRAVHHQFPDGIYLAYPNDLFKRDKLSTFPILSRRACDILIEPYPLAYQGAFIDLHLFDIFKRLQHVGYDRIRYLDDVIFEHCHYRAGKAARDETYRRRQRFADDPAFLGLRETRQMAAQHLRRFMQNREDASYQPPVYTPITPASPLSALMIYTRDMLFDKGLPKRWRIWLWVWFYGRFLAAQGWLRPFVR